MLTDLKMLTDIEVKAGRLLISARKIDGTFAAVCIEGAHSLPLTSQPCEVVSHFQRRLVSKLEPDFHLLWGSFLISHEHKRAGSATQESLSERGWIADQHRCRFSSITLHIEYFAGQAWERVDKRVMGCFIRFPA